MSSVVLLRLVSGDSASAMSLLQRDVPRDASAELSYFRTDFYACLTHRPDALFELSDALLCADDLVRTLVEWPCRLSISVGMLRCAAG